MSPHSAAARRASSRRRNRPVPSHVSIRMIDDIAHLGLLDDEDISLDEAALDLAALDHPGVPLAPYLARLGGNCCACTVAYLSWPHQQAAMPGAKAWAVRRPM